MSIEKGERGTERSARHMAQSDGLFDGVREILG